MSLQSPSSLIWFLPIAGAILLLYLLKMKRRDMRVPATFLWPERPEEIRANSLFQKLRPNTLMFLQLLAVGLLILAVARPQTRQKGLAGELTVLVLDASAGMQATDVSPSRFAEAKALAKEAILNEKPGDRLALIEAGPSPRVVFPLGSDPARQLIALDTLEPTDAEADTGEALRLAGALVGSNDGARIVLLSDGCFEKVTDFSVGKASLVFRPIGAKGENLAISALTVTQTPQGRKLFCAVANTGSGPMDGSLTLLADGKSIDSVKVSTRAGKQFTWTAIAPTGAKFFEAKLDAPDYLKSDNYAAVVADPAASLHVLLMSKGDLFLERALALDPRVSLDRALTLPSNVESKYDIVVFDGVPEQKVNTRGVLVLGASNNGHLVKSPAFESSESSPLLNGVDLREVFIDQAQILQPSGSERVLAKTTQGPLLTVSESGGVRRICLGFQPLQSDFPLQVGFPIFVANALDYLGGSADRSVTVVKTGVPFSVPSTVSGTLTDPQGNRHEVRSAGGALIVREVDRVGHYELQIGNEKRTVIGVLKSDRESNITPVRDLVVGSSPVKAVNTPVRFGDFWRPLALLCLVVLGAEWWLFARRS